MAIAVEGPPVSATVMSKVYPSRQLVHYTLASLRSSMSVKVQASGA